MSDEQTIFESVLVIKLRDLTPFVSYQFPPETDTKNDFNFVTQFCFPESKELLHKMIKNPKKYKSQTFSFVLTEADGRKKYGYCRRIFVLDPPECYVLMGYNTSFSLFAQVLDIVEQRRAISSSEVFIFLKSALAQQFPKAGETLKLRVISQNNDQPDEYELRRPADEEYLLDFVSYEPLFRCCTVSQVVDIFLSLLQESRVILVAKKIDVLTACVNAVSAMSYPFRWQHVFIPVLPKTMLEYCTAPMPFLIGLLSEDAERLARMPTEEDLVIFNLDRGKFVRAPASRADNDAQRSPRTSPPRRNDESEESLDEWRDMEAISLLRTRLTALVQPKRRGLVFDKGIALTFMQFLLDTLGDYRKFLQPQPKTSRDLPFDDKALLAARPRRVRAWLSECFAATQMREVFIRERASMLAAGKPVTGQYESALDDDAAHLATSSTSTNSSFEDASNSGYSRRLANVPICYKCDQRHDATHDWSVRKGRMLCHTCAQRPHGWRKFLKTPKASPTPTPSSPDTVRRTDDESKLETALSNASGRRRRRASTGNSDSSSSKARDDHSSGSTNDDDKPKGALALAAMFETIDKKAKSTTPSPLVEHKKSNNSNHSGTSKSNSGSPGVSKEFISRNASKDGDSSKDSKVKTRKDSAISSLRSTLSSLARRSTNERPVHEEKEKDLSKKEMKQLSKSASRSLAQSGERKGALSRLLLRSAENDKTAAQSSNSSSKSNSPLLRRTYSEQLVDEAANAIHMAAEAEFMALECGDDQLAEKIRAAAARAKLYSLSLFDEAATEDPTAKPLIDADGNPDDPSTLLGGIDDDDDDDDANDDDRSDDRPLRAHSSSALHAAPLSPKRSGSLSASSSRATSPVVQRRRVRVKRNSTNEHVVPPMILADGQRLVAVRKRRSLKYVNNDNNNEHDDDNNHINHIVDSFNNANHLNNKRHMSIGGESEEETALTEASQLHDDSSTSAGCDSETLVGDDDDKCDNDSVHSDHS